MNLFKKVLPLALSVALLTPALSASADQLGEGNAVSQGETQTFEISGFSDSQPATEYELQKESTAIRHIPDPLNTRSNQGLFRDSPIIAPVGTLMSYSFYDLKPGHHIVSNSSFSVASPGSISLTLVQHYYPSVPPQYEPSNYSLTYWFENSSWSSNAITVSGPYRDKNTTINWPYIPAGTYKVKILASSSNNGPLQGNGYVTSP